MRLNIGSGQVRIEGYKNLDLVKHENVDYIHNLENTPYPFKSNSIKEIRAWSVCEHLHDLDTFMNECHRILNKEGILDIKVPYYNCGSAIRPDHVRFFNYNWEKYYLNNSNALQSHLKKNWIVVSKNIRYGKLGKVIKFFLGARRTYLISLVLGEVIQGIDIKLKKDGENGRRK